MILRLLSENSNLHYYQGLHDIVITFLLVVGEEIAFAIMNMLVKYHIRWGPVITSSGGVVLWSHETGVVDVYIFYPATMPYVRPYIVMKTF